MPDPTTHHTSFLYATSHATSLVLLIVGGYSNAVLLLKQLVVGC
jgi:hypothetical protein